MKLKQIILFIPMLLVLTAGFVFYLIFITENKNEKPKASMKQIIILLSLFIIGCSKQKDYSYLNTDRRNCGQLYYISERHTAPPVLLNGKWLAYRIDTMPEGQVCGQNKIDFEAVHPDTTYSTCSIDKRDSAYRINIFRIVIK